jgi:hypothetical protein
MNQSINMWSLDGGLTSLGRNPRVNIRYLTRYDASTIDSKIYQKQWDSVKAKIRIDSHLTKLKNRQKALEKIGNNSENIGVIYDFEFDNEMFSALLRTEMGFIVLWKTDQTFKNYRGLNSRSINQLQDAYYALNHIPINLMFDDPTTYCKPYQDQGEDDES